ncbi:cellulose binding domain-containing protein [Micromonospora eburnea]|uniref:Activator of Hsp90 ATPase homolog 1-like protein n=1 Tax=Micromonospora eburnea TaxID=227316 RepID=A0A1C6UKQ4_9ACTN|nr:cellulose binding domain-containing protein [Micromonospora eburnea]SCL54670.1 Activator of Hsp90 ATPase homolog 1-like protein [Micromonospora eburnea]
MIEIGIEIDLFHPSDTVWRALTEPALLGKWFAESVPPADRPERLLLRTAGLPGFVADIEATVVERQAPQRYVLDCREGDQLTRLTCQIVPSGHGCRLSVREELLAGEWDAERHALRSEYHQQAVTVRLPAILDWLAFQRVDLRRAEGGLTAELPVVRLLGDGRTRAGRRRRAGVIGGGLACLALAGGAAVWLTRPAPRIPEATPQSTLLLPTTTSPAPKSTPSRTVSTAARNSATASPSPSQSPSPSPSTATPTRTPEATPTPAAPLTARYQTVSDRLFGYRGEVVVTNPGGTEKQDWAVVVTLATGAAINNATGVEWRQDGQVVTFTGKAVPAQGSTTFRFDVRDTRTRAPEGCTVDGAPCSMQ